MSFLAILLQEINIYAIWYLVILPIIQFLF